MNRRESLVAGLTGLTAVAILGPAAVAQEAEAPNPKLNELRALLKAHDAAMADKDVKGVMALFIPKPIVLGTGPGEIWSGPEEVAAAYEEFFKVYDKGQQKCDYQYTVGDVSGDAGWLATSEDIQCTKDGKKAAFPLNVSLTAIKLDGKWRIAAMHFSTLTDEEKK
jgi:uncharacterized protein (TIGR02246 family)